MSKTIFSLQLHRHCSCRMLNLLVSKQLEVDTMIFEREAGEAPLLTNERIIYSCSSVRFIYPSCPSETLAYAFRLTTRRLLFYSSSASSTLSIPHKSITLHAICEDRDCFPEPCLLIHVGDDDTGTRIVPEDRRDLQPIFEGICQGMRTNAVDDEEGDDWIERFEGGIQINPDAVFEDADECNEHQRLPRRMNGAADRSNDGNSR